jgi:regulator of protease activity HflC (stomatin/prohibitin superfamily)
LGTLAVIGLVVVAAAVIAVLSLQRVRAHEQMVIFRLGRTHEGLVRGPGIVPILPIVDRPVRVDIRPRVYHLSGVRATTSDEDEVLVDATIHCRVVDPLKSVVNVASLDGALPAVTETMLRAIAVEQTRADLLAGRDQLTSTLLENVRVPAARWGVEIDDLDVTDLRAVAG